VLLTNQLLGRSQISPPECWLPPSPFADSGLYDDSLRLTVNVPHPQARVQATLYVADKLAAKGKKDDAAVALKAAVNAGDKDVFAPMAGPWFPYTSASRCGDRASILEVGERWLLLSGRSLLKAAVHCTDEINDPSQKSKAAILIAESFSTDVLGLKSTYARPAFTLLEGEPDIKQRLEGYRKLRVVSEKLHRNSDVREEVHTYLEAARKVPNKAERSHECLEMALILIEAGEMQSVPPLIPEMVLPDQVKAWRARAEAEAHATKGDSAIELLKNIPKEQRAAAAASVALDLDRLGEAPKAKQAALLALEASQSRLPEDDSEGMGMVIEALTTIGLDQEVKSIFESRLGINSKLRWQPVLNAVRRLAEMDKGDVAEKEINLLLDDHFKPRAYVQLVQGLVAAHKIDSACSWLDKTKEYGYSEGDRYQAPSTVATAFENMNQKQKAQAYWQMALAPAEGIFKADARAIAVANTISHLASLHSIQSDFSERLIRVQQEVSGWPVEVRRSEANAAIAKTFAQLGYLRRARLAVLSSLAKDNLSADSAIVRFCPQDKRQAYSSISEP
jgi:hypothetical protein